MGWSASKYFEAPPRSCKPFCYLEINYSIDQDTGLVRRSLPEAQIQGPLVRHFIIAKLSYSTTLKHYQFNPSIFKVLWHTVHHILHYCSHYHVNNVSTSRSHVVRGYETFLSRSSPTSSSSRYHTCLKVSGRHYSPRSSRFKAGFTNRTCSSAEGYQL